jgi:hypothetical protein
MIGEFRRKTNIGILCGMLAQIIGFAASYYINIGIVMWVAAVFAWGGILLFIWGLWNYARGKGYRGAWGLLGLLSVFGLIILAFFPDRKKGA